MWHGYGFLNDIEVWNNQRVMDYLRGHPLSGVAGLAPVTAVPTRSEGFCPDAWPLYCDQPSEQPDGSYRYTTPELDDAPWYDAQVPESGDFAGLLVTEVTGFDSVVSRSFTQGAIRGAGLGPLKLGGRSITVTGWLRARTCCAAEYGLRWLQEALIGPTDCDDCAIDELVMLKCCPSEPDPQVADYIRYVQRVGLVDGPKVVDRMGTCCSSCGSPSLKVQFTLASESPYLFSEVTWSLYQEGFPVTEDWYDFYGSCQNCPEPPTTWQPECGPTVITPPAPFMVQNDCYCDPWCARTLCASYTNAADWNDATAVIEVQAGSADIKNLKITAYRNPWGETMPCPCELTDPMWACVEPCAGVEIAELPTGSTLVIDSRTRNVTLRLAGGAFVPGLRYISGLGGAPFGWFDVGHCSTLCFIATVDCSVASDATVSIGTVGKYLASGS